MSAEGDELGNAQPPPVLPGNDVDDPFKRFFICCDGTFQNASGTDQPQTNVARLARCVSRISHRLGERPCLQIVYYAAGVGVANFYGRWRNYISAFNGVDIEGDILDAYCFLCNNFTMAGEDKDDEIVLVGYSRGAYTVRCLASLIGTVGLLRRRWLPLLPVVYKEWRLRGQQGLEALRQMTAKYMAFRITSFVKIQVLAEWDPVSATSALNFVARDATVPRCVDNAFVALAHDEGRWPFAPRPWMKWPGHDERTEGNRVRSLRQVVFHGAHSDIGGGDADSGLATIPLLWMVAQIMSVSKADFDSNVLFETIQFTPASMAWMEWEGPTAAAAPNVANTQNENQNNTEDPYSPRLYYFDILHSQGKFVRDIIRRIWESPNKLGFKWLGADRHFAYDAFKKTAAQEVKATLRRHFTMGLLLEDSDNGNNIPDDSDSWAPIHNYEVMLWRRWRKHVQTEVPMPWDTEPNPVNEAQSADNVDNDDFYRWEQAAKALNLEELPKAAPILTAGMESYMTTTTLLGRLLLKLKARYRTQGAADPDVNVETKEDNGVDTNMDDPDPITGTLVSELYRNVTYKRNRMTFTYGEDEDGGFRLRTDTL